MLDLWYVTQTAGRVGTSDLSDLRRHLADSQAVRLEPIGLAVANAAMTIRGPSLLIRGTASSLRRQSRSMSPS